MKYFIILFLGFLIISCELDVKDENVNFVKIEAYNVQIPEELVVNQEYDVSFDYKLKSDCMHFYNVSFDFPADNIREITAFAEMESTRNCMNVYTEHTYTFYFKPMDPGVYILKFWVGKNSDGTDEFETYEISVVE
jgi:hypothetical protein